MDKNSKFILHKAYRFSVAPMMDCTDKHFRVMMRQISKRALLYSEMIVAKAIHFSNKRDHLLDFDPIEHPIALQIGGDDPKLLSEATKIAESWGYDEINLNIGCPSSKVQAGNFGACLMKNPDQVARCIEAMVKASNLDVTVKHRIGVDDFDSNDSLIEFIDRLSEAGAKRFSIHARKALLKGLDPKQNRSIPPLQYERVEYVKKNRPKLIIELNGGLNKIEDCITALKTYDGVMVGRAAYKHPLLWQSIDEKIFKEKKRNISASNIIKAMIPYAENHLKRNGKLWDLSKHLLNLVEGVPGAKAWRNNLSIKTQKPNADICILEKAVHQLKEAGL